MKHKLAPLTETEKKFAEENHNLIYSFLHRYGYSIEEYYDVVLFGYLKAVQIYHRREDLRGKYDFPFISWQYMRSEIGNHRRTESSAKRKTEETVLSLDAERQQMENFYNSVGGKSAEDDVMEKELLVYVLENLTNVQRKIVQSKIDGFSNKEVFQTLEIKQSTYYKEMQRIRAAVEELLA